VTTVGTALVVVAGALVGAPLRYVTELELRRRLESAFPWGTLVVNVVGSAVLGVVAGAVSVGAPQWLATGVGTGLCGALTTFSTFSYESVRLAEDGAARTAALYVGASLAVGLAACAAGWLLGVSL
jgi:CrcB protein